jgi:hypothetical protein
MPTVRITGNRPNNIHKTEWIGAPALDKQGHLARDIDIPEAAFQKIEKAVADGYTEGIVNLDSGLRYEWFLDR